jgi:hypothetical protein
MQTEISFLLQLILDEDLSPKVQKLCRKRIKEIEISMGAQRPTLPPTRPQALDQAPSTLKAMERHAMLPPPATLEAPNQIPPAARIIGGEVNTGAGTKGPRKF